MSKKENIQYHSGNFPYFKRDTQEKEEKMDNFLLFNNKEDWLQWLKNQPLKRSPSNNKLNKNIFHIHIPKTGGISMKNYIYGDTFHYNNFGHHSAWRLREWFKSNGNEEEWNNYYKFSIVRNPWDILWSGYKYTKWGAKDVNPKSKTPDLLKPLDNPNIMYFREKYDNVEAAILRNKNNVSALKGIMQNNSIASSFKEYVEVIYNSKMENPYSGRLVEMYDEELGYSRQMNMPFTTFQFPHIIDFETGETIVDYIGKFEEMDKTVKHLADITGDNNIIHSFNLSSKNVSSTEVHYKNMYDDDMINMVGEIYKEDILRFNYDF